VHFGLTEFTCNASKPFIFAKFIFEIVVENLSSIATQFILLTFRHDGDSKKQRNGASEAPPKVPQETTVSEPVQFEETEGFLTRF
jgi:hypothetical protein